VQYLVDRSDPSISPQQQHEIIVKKVEEFLDNPAIKDSVLKDIPNVEKIEPSGAATALMQMQMISQTMQ